MLHRLFLRHRSSLFGKEITDCLILIYEWFGKVYNEWDQKYEVIIVKKCTVERETSEKQIPEKETAKTEFKTTENGNQTLLSEGELAEPKVSGQTQSEKDGTGTAEKTDETDKNGRVGKSAKQRALAEKLKLILVLGLSFLKIGLFTFGGGYAMIALIQKEFVSKRKWISEAEFMDVVAISESTPGPLAINSATYIGYKVGKAAGATISTLCVCIPSFTIIYLISLFFDAFLKFTVVQYAFKGIQVCVVFLIFTAGWKMLKQMQKDLFNWILFIATFLCLVVFSVTAIDFSSIFYILICGAAGLGVYLISLARKGDRKKETAVSAQKQNDVEQKNEQNTEQIAERKEDDDGQVYEQTGELKETQKGEKNVPKERKR